MTIKISISNPVHAAAIKEAGLYVNNNRPRLAEKIGFHTPTQRQINRVSKIISQLEIVKKLNLNAEASQKFAEWAARRAGGLQKIRNSKVGAHLLGAIKVMAKL